MFEIKVNKHNDKDGIDYFIQGNVVVILYEKDWNGELYTKGYYQDGTERKNWRYKPVYKQINEDEYEIIGFEEV